MMQRSCNGCTLCCKLLPVKELGKPANVRCIHQRSLQGCAVYRTDKFPRSCKAWSCLWLIDPETLELARPDRSHYVLDVMPDYIEVNPDENTCIKIPVVQVWVDPKHRDAHKDPALRKFLLGRYKQYQQWALIRYSATEAFVLVPPPVSPTRDWYLQDSNTSSGPEHDIGDIMEVLR